MMNSRCLHAAILAAAALVPATVHAQHTDSMPGMPGMSVHADTADKTAHAHDTTGDMESRMAGVLGIPHTRLGSGTSWQPQSAPHYGWHFVRGSWSLMVHGIAYAEYDKQLGTRGDDQV